MNLHLYGYGRRVVAHRRLGITFGGETEPAST
jgi:hypothetical protein